MASPIELVTLREALYRSASPARRWLRPTRRDCHPVVPDAPEPGTDGRRHLRFCAIGAVALAAVTTCDFVGALLIFRGRSFGRRKDLAGGSENASE